MSSVTSRPADLAATDPVTAPEGDRSADGGDAAPLARRRWWWAVLEGLGVLVSPVAAFYVLRLRPMAPPGLPDPSMSSTYIFDPKDYFYRFNTLFTPTARMREGARVGFLVPARLSYLAFGAVPGFFAFRYVLAVVAVAPAYLLLKRRYGVGAGVLAIVVIMSSPVLITAWGTDFPDSAVVSYLLGALACLLMPTAGRRARAGWLVAAAFLFTMAVWALATSAAIVAVLLAAYLVVRLVRDRHHLGRHVALLAGVAAAVTVALAFVSDVELGQLNYVTPTIRALEYLATPTQEAMWHSRNWRWAPYQAHVLVPFAVAVAIAVVVGRHWRSASSATLVVSLGAVGVVVAGALLQFVGSVQILEEHYFFSTLWSPVCLALVVLLAELTRPLATHRLWRFAPAALVVAVALVYETDPHVPRYGWLPVGIILAVAVVVAAVVGHRLSRVGLSAVGLSTVEPSTVEASARRRGLVARIGSAVAVVAVTGLVLVLTVAQSPYHRPLAGTVPDPPTNYQSALGGQATQQLDVYRLISHIRGFVGNATYRNEHVMTCQSSHSGLMLSAIGQFHTSFMLLEGLCPDIDPQVAVGQIEFRQAAQLLVMSSAPLDIDVVLHRLAALDPFLARDHVYRSGSDVLRLWLVEIPRYLTPPQAA